LPIITIVMFIVLGCSDSKNGSGMRYKFVKDTYTLYKSNEEKPIGIFLE
jgi:hypothetical protein